MEHWRWPDHDRYPGYNGTTTCKVYISPISKNLPRRTDGLRSRDYQMCDYWRRNEELRPSTIVKDVLFNDSRWLHDQALRSTHLSHKTLGLYISRAWLLWKRVKGLSHTSLRSKSFRAVSQAYFKAYSHAHQNFSHAKIAKFYYRQCSAAFAWRESFANTGRARETREQERKPPASLSSRVLESPSFPPKKLAP